MTHATAVTALHGTHRDPAANMARAMERNLGITLDDHQWWNFNFDGWPVISAVIDITPDLAAKWLNEHNSVTPGKENRNITKVNKWRVEIQEGLWEVSPQSIVVFDEDGDVLDGQHRLMAIKEIGGDGLPFRVEYGWPRKSFCVIDRATTKCAGQLLHKPFAGDITAAARIVAAVSGMATRSQVKDRITARANPNLVLAWEKEWPELSRYAQTARAIYRTCKLNPPIHLAILAQAARTRYAHMIPAWLEALETGAGLSSSDPRLHLRNKWITGFREMSGSTSHRGAPYAMTVNAWNAYAEGRTMKLLKLPQTRASSGEPVPVRIPFVTGFSEAQAEIRRKYAHDSTHGTLL